MVTTLSSEPAAAPPSPPAWSWQRLGLAIALGVAGLVLNRARVPLLGEETPDFLFGGMPVLASYFWLGPVAGTLTGVIASAESLARFDAVGLAPLVYLVEAWVVSATFRRTGSLVLSAVGFWFVVGWALDLAIYGWWIGLPWHYLVLLYVKQVFGGALNALAVDGLLEVAFIASWTPLTARAPRGDLQYFTRRRILLAFTTVVVAVGVLFTRSTYLQRRDAAVLLQQESASAIASDVRTFLVGRAAELRVVANEFAIARSVGTPWTDTRLAELHASRSDFLNIGVTDAGGIVRVMSPSTGSTGQPLGGHSVAHRSYFSDARQQRDTVFAPLIMGTLHVRNPADAEPIIVVAHPLFGLGGTFLGVAFGAVPASRFRPAVQARRRAPAHEAVLFDSQGHIIAASGQEHAPGQAMSDVIPPGTPTTKAWRGFSYDPHGGDLSHRLRINPVHAVLQDVPPAGWQVLVAEPAGSLHAAMAPAVGFSVFVLALAIGLAHVAANVVARSVVSDLSAVREAAHAFASGHFDTAEVPDLGADSSIGELRQLGADMNQLGAVLRQNEAFNDARHAEVEERFRATFDQAAVGIAHLSTDGVWMMVNDRLCSIVGRSREELLEFPVTDVLARDGRMRMQRDRSLLLSDEVPATTDELQVVLPDGTTTWVQITLSLVRDGEGQPRYLIAVVEDLAERKRLEAIVLEQERNQLESVLEQMSGGVVVVDLPDGVVSRANERAGQLLGRVPQVGERIADFWRGRNQTLEGRPFSEQDCPACRALRGESVVADVLYTRTDDQQVVLQIRTSPVRDAAGAMVSALLILFDVTELKAAETEVRRAHAETEEMLASMAAVLVEVDAGFRVTRWNAQASRTFGLAAADVMGRDLLSLDLGWNSAEVARLLGEARDTNEATPVEDVVFTAQNVDHGVMALLVTPVGDGQGRMRFTLLGRDESPRRQLEQQLSTARRLEGIGELAAGVAHEINTPIQYIGDNVRFVSDHLADLKEIVAVSEAVARDVADRAGRQVLSQFEAARKRLDAEYLETEVPQALQDALEGVDRVASIVRALKEFAHPGQMEFLPVDVNHVLRNTLTVSRNEWKYVADVKTNLAPDLPNIQARTGDLNHVFLNVIINAAHAIEQKGGSQRGLIEVESLLVGTFVEVKIRDSGCGMPPEVMRRVFDPFFTTKDVGKGTGQGLPIARAAVVRHGGDISLESVPGTSTTVTVRLPLTQQREDALPHADVANG